MSIVLTGKLSIASTTITIDVSLEGKVTGVYGASGSGKTTLLDAVAGFNSALDQLTIKGKSFASFKAQERGFGYAMQDGVLYPHMTVAENIRFGANETSLFEFDFLVDGLGLSGLLSRLPNRLSGGEKQRVMIARAMYNAKNMLLLDEPVSALDISSKRQVLRFLRKALESIDLPVIFVSHQLEDFSLLCDQVMSLNEQAVEVYESFNGFIKEHIAEADLEAIEVSFESQHCKFDKEAGVAQYDTGNNIFYLPVDDEESVKKLAQQRIIVKAKDVSLSLNKHADTSILNILAGAISAEQSLKKGKVLLTINANGDEILAVITEYSYKRLQLKMGSPVFAQIKSVAVDV